MSSAQIKLRRDTATNWTSANPILADGEFGYERDTQKAKVGNGVSDWTSLAYLSDAQITAHLAASNPHPEYLTPAEGDGAYAPLTHAASTVNPHAVTKTQVGLGNVDNTSNATERAATATLTNKTIVAANNTITTAASGNLSATSLNAALAELQTDIDTRATSSVFTTHTSDTTTAHGTTGAVVGTTNTQTLTNKSFGNAVTITDNSASPALKVTQTGAGNALEIHDVASDTTPFVIDANGNTSLGALSVFRQRTGSVTFDATPTVGANDGLIWNASASTGYYAWQAGGVDRMRISSTGVVDVTSDKIRINSTNNDSALEFHNTGVRKSYIRDYGSGLTIVEEAAQPILFYANGAERMRIDSSGTVAVGTGGFTVNAAYIPGLTSLVQLDTDILLSSPNHSLMGNMYYSAGWKYAGNGSGASIKLAESSDIAMSIQIASNNTGGAGAVAAPNIALAILPDTRVRINKTTSTAAFNTTFECAGQVLGQNSSSALIAYNPTTQTSIMLHCADAAVDKKQTELIQTTSGNFSIRTIGDAYAGVSNGFIMERGTGAALTTVQLFDGRFVVDASGVCKATSATGGLGYGTGAGGTVTQATSKSTSVTLNKPCGQITMHNEALAAGNAVAFFVTNSIAGLDNTVLLSIQNTSISTGIDYNYWATMTVNGFFVFLKNISGGSLSEAVVINFAIIKGSAS